MRRRAKIALATLLLAALCGPRPAEADMTYLALGDSLAFGETDFPEIGGTLTTGSLIQSNGDRGYVGRFADHLAAFNGGVRPGVVNLGVDGENTRSFTAGAAASSIDPLFRPLVYAVNSNYNGSAAASQADRLLEVIAGQAAQGHTISFVTISLGANDLLPLLTLAPADQAAQVPLALQTLATNYGTLIGTLHALLPQAQVVALGYYNPYPGLVGVDQATLDATGTAIGLLNATIQGVSAAAGATYIGTAGAFLGHEADYTFINQPILGNANIHPNAAGYTAIAGQLNAVPEPGSLALLGLGLALAGVAARRRRAG